jgi:hypothetical protein
MICGAWGGHDDGDACHDGDVCSRLYPSRVQKSLNRIVCAFSDRWRDLEAVGS